MPQDYEPLRVAQREALEKREREQEAARKNAGNGETPSHTQRQEGQMAYDEPNGEAARARLVERGRSPPINSGAGDMATEQRSAIARNNAAQKYQNQLFDEHKAAHGQSPLRQADEINSEGHASKRQTASDPQRHGGTSPSTEHAPHSARQTSASHRQPTVELEGHEHISESRTGLKDEQARTEARTQREETRHGSAAPSSEREVEQADARGEMTDAMAERISKLRSEFRAQEAAIAARQSTRSSGRGGRE